MRRTTIVLFAVLAVLFAFVSCDPNETTWVRFDLSMMQASGADVSASMKPATYVVHGECAKKSLTVEKTFSANERNMYIDAIVPGKWIFHVDALNSNGVLIGTGLDFEQKVCKDDIPLVSINVDYCTALLKFSVKLPVSQIVRLMSSLSGEFTLNGVSGLQHTSVYFKGQYDGYNYILLEMPVPAGACSVSYGVYDSNGDLIGNKDCSFEIPSAKKGQVFEKIDEFAITESPVSSSTYNIVKDGQVSFTCPTAGATIYYTTDGSSPASASSTRQVYTAPITVSQKTTFKVCAFSDNLPRSNVVTYELDVHVPNPVVQELSESSFIISDDGLIHLDVTCPMEEAVIRYEVLASMFGSAPYPTESSPVYLGTITPSGSYMQVNFTAFKDGLVKSGYVTARGAVKVEQPVPDHEGGTYNNTFSLELDCQNFAIIKYKVGSGTQTDYSEPITIDGSTTLTVNAYHNSISGVQSSDLVVEYILKVADPSFNVVETTADGTVVEIASITDDAVIHYTLDGSTPTEADPIYTSAVTVPQDGTINAVGFRTGFENSDVSSVSY